MPLYRLLRNNKESGPYSLNDLVILGLKPYDLVWVDGKSAAWRYPSEVSELKSYAPIVEEQPFDRFFKKPGVETPKEINIAQETTFAQQRPINDNLKKEEIRKEQPKEIPVEKINAETINPSSLSKIKNQVFVSMPEPVNFQPYADPYRDDKYEQYLPKEKSIQQKPFVAEDKYSPIDIQEPDENKLQTKYSQSLDDIKEMYINTLVQRKTRNRKKEIFGKYVKPALLPCLLIVVGITIGYFITYWKNPLQSSRSVSKVVPPQATHEQKNESTPADQNENNNVQHQDKKNQDPVSTVDNKNQQLVTLGEQHKKEKTIILPSVNQRIKLVQPSKDKPLTDSKVNNLPAKEKETLVDENPVPKKNVEVDPNTGERKSVVRDNNDLNLTENNNRSVPERTTKKNNQQPSFLEDDHKNIRDLVSVKSNDYIRGSFGGIRGLELTVFNSSDFLLDEVSVELQIIKPSNEPLRTDIITFKNISANGAVTVKVPDSQRGIRVEYRITNVASKQWQKSTAGL